MSGENRLAKTPADESSVVKLPEEDEILKLTTGVVKSVKELSDKVHKLKPSDYVELVKVR